MFLIQPFIEIVYFCFFTAASSSSTVLLARGCPLPPQIPRGQYQILPWRRSFSSSSSSPRMWNLNGSSVWPSSSSSSSSSSTFLAAAAASSTIPPLVPIYSSAVYTCYRGYVLSGGSSLISCSPGGWWQPIHNAPRCVPHVSSASSSSSSSSAAAAAAAASGINLHHRYGTAPFFSFFFLILPGRRRLLFDFTDWSLTGQIIVHIWSE